MSCLQYLLCEVLNFLLSSSFQALGNEYKGNLRTVAKWWAGTVHTNCLHCAGHVRRGKIKQATSKKSVDQSLERKFIQDLGKIFKWSHLVDEF